jgi:hypothetical protein
MPNISITDDNTIIVIYCGTENVPIPIGTAGGDLSGTYPNPNVEKIKGNAVPTNAAGALTNDGNGALSWTPQSGGGGTPAGSDTQIQFNNAGAFGASAGLTWESDGVLNIKNSDGNGILRLWNSSQDQYVDVQFGGSSTGSFIFPNDGGANGRHLVTDGNGNTSWVNPVTTGQGVPSVAPAAGVINYIDLDMNSLWVWTGAAWFGPYVPTP